MNKYVNICGIPHKVIECDDNFNVDLHFGQIDYAKCEIKINKCLGEKSREETLAHEMLHGIFVHLGFDEYAHDEHLVQCLANAIAQGFSVRVQTEYEVTEINTIGSMCEDDLK